MSDKLKIEDGRIRVGPLTLTPEEAREYAEEMIVAAERLEGQFRFFVDQRGLAYVTDPARGGQLWRLHPKGASYASRSHWEEFEGRVFVPLSWRGSGKHLILGGEVQ